jgi:hypothetical protein
MNHIKFISLAVFLTAILTITTFAQTTGSITGQVVDINGALVQGATVTVVSSEGKEGKEKTATSNKNGEFTINNLQPGSYVLSVAAQGFQPFSNPEVQVTAGNKTELKVPLAIEIKETVNVNAENEIGLDPAMNAGATILKDKDLDALPDDPDELEAALQAMAGAAAGPDGGQIYIDGFTGGRMPPKEAIREIRINQNPFSAEYDRVGFGRIEILTKPGFDKYRGSANFNFNDESLNSRNPFALNRAPSQMRNFGGFFSGPIKAHKSSFFVDVNRTSNDSNSVISAIVLDPNLNPAALNMDVTVPTRRFSISPRLDFSINSKNTLTTRYSYTQSTSLNQGIGGFSLPTRATTSDTTQNNLQMTESMIINPKTVNETRFQYEWNRSGRKGDSSIPTINVANSFTGGGSQTGDNFTNSNRWEVANTTTTSIGKNSSHSIKFGIRVRGITINDQSESNYGGTFTFSGVPAVIQCDTANPPNCVTISPAISSIEQYRQKVLGNPDPRFNPNQFTITTGNPLASVSQIDYSPFFTDDWKMRQDFTFSFGLRYENQTNLKDNFNFAPRLGFAWAPGTGGAKAPKTVFRGGVGIFYDRFSENNTLRAERNDGVTQLQFNVSNNSPILSIPVFTNIGVTNVPTGAQIQALTPLSSIPFRIPSDLQAPYSIQAAISVERQLPYKSVLSATFTAAKSEHILRMRNINAPDCPNIIVCPAGLTLVQLQPLRPDPTQGNIYQIESSGYAFSKLVTVNIRTNVSPRITFNAGYTLSFSDGDTDSLNSPRVSVNAVGFPAFSYNTSGEFAPSVFNARHSIFVIGSVSLPWGFRMSPNITASSGRPFNITTGVDSNYDTAFAERPTFQQLHDRCVQLGLTAAYCNISGIADPSTTIIPRNYGKGTGSFIVNMNLSKTFGFGTVKSAVAQNRNGGNGDAGGGGGGNRGGGGGGRGGGGGGARGGGGGFGGGGGGFGGGGGGGGGFFGSTETPKRYNLTFSMNVNNLFNTVNFNSPIGALTSPSFGLPRSTAGSYGFFGGGGAGGSANRRIELVTRFSF